MRIEFKVRTNEPCPMINAAYFNMKNGFQIKIDRNITEFCEPDSDGIMNMLWKECYIWEIDGENLFDGQLALLNNDTAAKFFNENTQSVEFEIEDEAPEDYEVTIMDWNSY